MLFFIWLSVIVVHRWLVGPRRLLFHVHFLLLVSFFKDLLIFRFHYSLPFFPCRLLSPSCCGLNNSRVFSRGGFASLLTRLLRLNSGQSDIAFGSFYQKRRSVMMTARVFFSAARLFYFQRTSQIPLTSYLRRITCHRFIIDSNDSRRLISWTSISTLAEVHLVSCQRAAASDDSRR